jgi:cell wall-associated NlpC family hydrolase
MQTVIREHQARQMFLKLCWHFLEHPYRWGGDDPVLGFDCSGLVCELLRSVGKLNLHERLSSQMIYERFHIVCQPIPQDEIEPGDLLFWASNRDERRIYHIAACIEPGYMIEAGGGNAETDTPEEAAARNAFVRIRPLRDCFAVLRIFS